MFFQLVVFLSCETQGLRVSLDVTDFRQAKGTADGSFGPSNGVNVELEKPEGVLDSHGGSLLSPRYTVLTFALVIKNPKDWISFSTSALQLLDQKKTKTWLFPARTQPVHVSYIHICTSLSCETID